MAAFLYSLFLGCISVTFIFNIFRLETRSESDFGGASKWKVNDNASSVPLFWHQPSCVGLDGWHLWDFDGTLVW